MVRRQWGHREMDHRAGIAKPSFLRKQELDEKCRVMRDGIPDILFTHRVTAKESLGGWCLNDPKREKRLHRFVYFPGCHWNQDWHMVGR